MGEQQHCPEMKSILELSGYTFEIPVYQRGFRWTRQQVKELMQDLYEFSEDTEKSTYCLQNITVREKTNEAGETVYEVIDGQQRLTAIWILVMAFMDSKKYDEERMPVYSLVYQHKEGLTDYVRAITELVETAPGEQSILRHDHPRDIDSCFIHDAFSYIIGGDYKLGSLKYSAVLSAVFNNRFISEAKRIEVIWNVIDTDAEDEAGRTAYVIERFSNLNANKIPLTESELIKAHFINRLDEGRVEQFSHQWEEMERGLNDEEFWRFISSGKDEETRMDILFRVHLARMNIDFSGHHNLSKIVSSRLTDGGRALEEWKQIVQIYHTLYDWYNDYYFYHMVGLIIAVESADASTIIKDMYTEYTASTKEEFKSYLKERIRRGSSFDILFSSRGKQDWSVEKAEDILLVDDTMAYGKQNSVIKATLLLFNISLLVNAYAVNTENSAERFSFKIYKNPNNAIEIEHINPQHLEGKDADNKNYTADDKRQWAEETLKIIASDEERDELTKKVREADWGNRNTALIERLEEAAHLHAIGNLTLVDKNLNIRYGDHFFRAKRSSILAARFGQPIPDNPDRYYKQSVIFPGTMWVFMRQYTDAHDAERWVAEDQKAYIECMQNSIFTLLKPERKEDVTDESAE